jgi:uncharacterized protein YggE
MKLARMFSLLVLGTTLAFAQDIQVNRQNKTIAVTADDSVEADAEVAVLAIGYHNFGTSQEVAFQENVRVSNAISKALLDAGVPKDGIETDKLQLRRMEVDEKWTPEMKKERQFSAQESWKVTVSASQAQDIVDVAVKNGANEVEDVDWNVADPVALQARAGGAALAKARRIAEQMANGLNAKLGDLVYASNRAPVSKFFRQFTLNTAMAEVGPKTQEKPKLKLFPQKVKSDATVYAVFAIE